MHQLRLVRDRDPIFDVDNLLHRLPKIVQPILGQLQVVLEQNARVLLISNFDVALLGVVSLVEDREGSIRFLLLRALLKLKIELKRYFRGYHFTLRELLAFISHFLLKNVIFNFAFDADISMLYPFHQQLPRLVVFAKFVQELISFDAVYLAHIGETADRSSVRPVVNNV